MPAFTTPDNIQYPIQTDPVVPLAGVFEALAQSTQNALSAIEQEVQLPRLIETTEKTGNYTLAIDDDSKVVLMNPAVSATLTVPNNSSVAFDLGTVINVYNASGNDVTIVGASGVTVRNNGGALSQFAEISLRKRATNEWVIAGNLN